MIKKDFIAFVSSKTGIDKLSLIEKDLLLHSILFDLIKNKDFRENIAFKGGTCLIKCYFGYYRFSEDIDFTYLKAKEFEGKSANSVRKMISDKIDKISEQLLEIAEKLQLDFKLEKNNRRYFEFGGGNKFTTFKLWYTSAVSETESFIKIQINFAEKLFYPVKEIEIRPIFDTTFEKEIKFVYPEYSYFLESIKIKSYDLHEILIEKIRAILTRKVIKGRDLIDAYLIIHKIKPNFEVIKKQSLEKIKFMLKFEKYSENIQNKNLELLDKFVLGDESKLMIKEIPESFNTFLKDFKVILNDVKEKIKNG